MNYNPITLLFLMSSLIMLAAPFASTNLFSDAMAQGYDDDDNYDSYNNYNSDSKDLTKDKLYECKKGPFKGFVVSSVEFCKRLPPIVVDDDDDDDDDNGATPITINATNLYTVVGNTAGGVLFRGEAGAIPVIPPLITVSSIATCDAGDLALGGSFVVTGPSTILTDNRMGSNNQQIAVNTIKSSQPLDTQNGWNATALVFGFGGTVTADAVCFDNPPLRP